jgi:polar amino acid transport system substrate-binding protein
VLREVKMGTIDAAVGSSFKKERALYGVYPLLEGKDDLSKRIMSQSYLLYQRKGEALLWDGNRFNATGKVFGVMRLYAVVSELKERGLNVIEVGTQKQLLEMLHLNRIDGAIAWKAI